MTSRDLGGTDDDVGLCKKRRNRLGRGKARGHPRTEQRFGMREPVGLAVDQRDLSAQPNGHARGAHADRAGADDEHMGGRYPGHAADQLAIAAVGRVQAQRTHLRREPSGNVRHWLQERQAASGVAHGFIGNRRHAARHQLSRQFRRGRQVQIAEQQLACAQQRHFVRLRFLHFHHQVGGIDFGRGGSDDRTGGTVGIVVESHGGAGTRLDAHPVPGLGQYPYTLGRECHPVFVILDFLGNADVHGEPRAGWIICSIAKATPRQKCRLYCAGADSARRSNR